MKCRPAFPGGNDARHPERSAITVANRSPNNGE
jgi:hypothetical protein